MSKYERLEEGLSNLKDATPEEKLIIIHAESFEPLSSIKGLAMILKEWSDSQSPDVLPDFFEFCVDGILEAANAIQTIHRSLARRKTE